MKAKKIEEPFKLRDCEQSANELYILNKTVHPDAEKESTQHKELRAVRDARKATNEEKEYPPASLGEALSNKILEIEAILRTFFEEKLGLPKGSLNTPMPDMSQIMAKKDEKASLKKDIPRAFKWSLNRDFEMSLFEVYFISEHELKIMFKDVASGSAVSAYPPPPKPKVIGYGIM